MVADGQRVEGAQAVDLVSGTRCVLAGLPRQQSGTLLCPVRLATKVEATDFEEPFLSHDSGLHCEEFPNLVALDEGEAQRDT